jgi:hypothetical protein
MACTAAPLTVTPPQTGADPRLTVSCTTQCCKDTRVHVLRQSMSVCCQHGTQLTSTSYQHKVNVGEGVATADAQRYWRFAVESYGRVHIGYPVVSAQQQQQVQQHTV